MFCYDPLPDNLRNALILLALGLAWYLTARRRSWLLCCDRMLFKIAQRPLQSLLLVGLLVFSVNLLLTLLHYPQPWIHDEYSYLLAADTYAHGRLSNPPHPMWQHLETYHTLFQPTYMSKYPAGNGLMLALGILVAGHAIVGAWIALSLSIMAMHWMFRGWMPARWALLGGLLLAIHVPLLKAWGQTYWGGSVQMLGGALLFGALPRILREPKWQYGFLLGLGAVILAFSRPFEGIIACLMAATVLGWWLLFQGSVPLRAKLVGVALPAGLVGLLGATALMINNYAVTGRVAKMPYSLHSQQYKASALFWWNPLPAEKEYRIERMERYYTEWSRNRQASLQTPDGYLALAWHKLKLLGRFFPFLSGICLLPLPLLLKRRWIRYAALAVLITIVIELQLVTSYAYPHYVAPLAGLFYLIALYGLRYWKVASRQYPLARLILPTVVVFACANLVAFITVTARYELKQPRAVIEDVLHEQPGRHLVIVRYPDDYTYLREWVFNDADVDEAKIVWAHELPGRNQELLDYFPSHQTWIWNVGAEPPTLLPFDRQEISEKEQTEFAGQNSADTTDAS